MYAGSERLASAFLCPTKQMRGGQGRDRGSGPQCGEACWEATTSSPAAPDNLGLSSQASQPRLSALVLYGWPAWRARGLLITLQFRPGARESRKPARPARGPLPSRSLPSDARRSPPGPAPTQRQPRLLALARPARRSQVIVARNVGPGSSGVQPSPAQPSRPQV